MTLVWINNNNLSMELFDKAHTVFHNFGKNCDERGQNRTIPFDVSAQHSCGETAEVLTE